MTLTKPEPEYEDWCIEWMKEAQALHRFIRSNCDRVEALTKQLIADDEAKRKEAQEDD